MDKSSGYVLLKLLMTMKKILAQDPDNTQFICSVNDYQYKESMSYNNIIYHISNQ